MGIVRKKQFAWTDAIKAELRRLWDVEPKLPASEIAVRLGCSRNSVIGMAHRLKCPSRGSPIKPPSARSIAKAARVPRAPKVTLPPLSGRLTHLLQPKVASEPKPIRPSYTGTWNGAKKHAVMDHRQPDSTNTVTILATIAKIASGEQTAIDAQTPSRIATFQPRPLRGTCCFPMWGDRERPSHVFCDAPTVGGSYCVEHHRVAYRVVSRDYLPHVGWV